MPRRSWTGSAALAVTLLAGCAAEVGGDAPTEAAPEGDDAQPTASVATVEHGDRTVGFVDVGGEIALAELLPAGALPLSVALDQQDGTALDLYLTLTGSSEDDAPTPLLEDHYARVERAPHAIELAVTATPQVPEGATLGDIPVAPFAAQDVARGVSSWSNSCSTSTLAWLHFLIMQSTGRTNVAVLGSGDNVTWGRADAPRSSRDFHYSSCPTQNAHDAWVFKDDTVPEKIVDLGSPKVGQIFHFSYLTNGSRHAWIGLSSGRSAQDKFGFLGTQMW